MSASPALFHILYAHDTLYQLPENLSAKAEPIEPKIVRQVDSPDLAKVESPGTEPAFTILTPAADIANQGVVFPLLNHTILILIDEPKQSEMPSGEYLFLDNILKAVKHSAASADIINYSFLPNSDATSVLEKKKTNYFITFGVPLIKLHLDLLLIPYTPKLVEGIWFLLTDQLVVIEADRDLKKKLWQALQKMFENV